MCSTLDVSSSTLYAMGTPTGEHDMVTITLTAKNLADARWTDAIGRTRGFESTTRCWGIVDDRGRALSYNGEHPSVWSTKKIAKLIADTVVLDDSITWVEVA